MSECSVPPKVFISYSWEGELHKTWVRGLAERLTRNGVNVRLDQWHIFPGQSLTQFMEVEAQGCDYVLIICTKDYNRKSLLRSGGVGYEQQIITGRIASGLERERFIPIIRDGGFSPGPDCSVPPQFSGIYAIDMRDESGVDRQVESILRAVFKTPERVQPVIGRRPDFSLMIPQNESMGGGQRLAVLDMDGWHLISGVASSQRYPKTFTIPGASRRHGLSAGDLVKLYFEFALFDADGNDELFAERMWVEVTGFSGPYLVGELRNQPVCSDEQDSLSYGDVVVFLPEHVIDIE